MGKGGGPVGVFKGDKCGGGTRAGDRGGSNRSKRARRRIDLHPCLLAHTTDIITLSSLILFRPLIPPSPSTSPISHLPQVFCITIDDDSIPDTPRKNILDERAYLKKRAKKGLFGARKLKKVQEHSLLSVCVKVVRVSVYGNFTIT